MANPLERPILKTLKGGPQSTRQLARAVHESRRPVFSACKGLEKRHKVKSHLRPGRKIYFFTVNGEVVRQGNYEQIQQMTWDLREIFDRNLKAVAAKKKPPTAKLLTELRRHLRALAAGNPDQADRIREFLDELLAAAKAGATWSELRQLIGLRPATPRIWSLP